MCHECNEAATTRSISHHRLALEYGRRIRGGVVRAGGDGRRSGVSIRRSAVRAMRRLPALYVAVLAWAVSVVAGDVIPRGLIARALLLVGVVVALYAATAALVVFLACGRFGIVRRPQWRGRAAAIALASSFVWIVASAWCEGRSALDVFAIAAAQLTGVGLYLGRRSALAAARGRLRVDP
jgi:hypothetical protein